MPIEVDFLLWLHGLATSPLDALFLISHHIGTGRAWIVIVTLVVLDSVRRGERRQARAWAVLGLSVHATQLGLKEAIGRVRPSLWAGPLRHTSPSMPSGHALAAAAFYGLAAYLLASRFPQYARRVYAAAALAILYVGGGRLYLGVHWPTDVLAGWGIGLAYAWVASRYIARVPVPS